MIKRISDMSNMSTEDLKQYINKYEAMSLELEILERQVLNFRRHVHDIQMLYGVAYGELKNRQVL